MVLGAALPIIDAIDTKRDRYVNLAVMAIMARRIVHTLPSWPHSTSWD
jgi:hypothetical protein